MAGVRKLQKIFYCVQKVTSMIISEHEWYRKYDFQIMIRKVNGGAENAGVDNAAPSRRGGKRGEIWRPKKKWNMLNDKHIKACTTRYDNSRIQFLTAVSHSMGAHSEALCPAADSSSSSDEDEASWATTTAADSL